MMTVYRENILRQLEYISDYQRQKIDWLSQDKPWSWFANEVTLLEDSCLYDNLVDNIILFNSEIDNILKQLVVAIESVDENLPQQVILESQEMSKVRALASRAARMIEMADLTENDVRENWK